MKTDDLIAALSADLPPASRRDLDRRMLIWLVPAAAVVLVGVCGWLGFRPGLGNTMLGPIFWAKAAYTVALAVGGFWLLGRLGRPGSGVKAPLLFLTVVLAVASGLAAFELLSMPAPERMPAVMGDSARVCAPNIIILSLLAAPFVFQAARAFAPTRPGTAGAAAGLLTSGLAATLYGLHCPEHSAAFVAVWYSLGIGIAVIGGFAAGRLAFRW